jgi:hypothetical protein
MKSEDTNSLPQDAKKLFEEFTATEVIETFEMLDLMMVSQGVKREFSPEFEQRYEHTFFLLKRLIRALDPEKKGNKKLLDSMKS